MNNETIAAGLGAAAAIDAQTTALPKLELVVTDSVKLSELEAAASRSMFARVGEQMVEAAAIGLTVGCCIAATAWLCSVLVPAAPSGTIDA